MICYMMQGSKARSLSYLQNQATQLTLVIVLPPLQGDHSSLLENAQTGERPALSIITPRLRPALQGHQSSLPHPLPNLPPAKSPPCQRPPTHQGEDGPRPPPRSPPQHWGAESAPPGAPCQCRGSCAQGKRSPFWGSPPLTVPWL